MSARILLFILMIPACSSAATVNYEFGIGTKNVNITGAEVEALAIDNQIPAPTIRASIGDTLRATFHNSLDVTTSVHWHGILLPGDQDGVPYMNTQPIAPGGSHTFEFPILHAGTFWYHSHTDLQIQKGLYGAVVLTEDNSASKMPEEVILFSDWTDDAAETVLDNLKANDSFYSFDKDSVQSWDKVIRNGKAAIANRINSSFTRMGPMDLTDVGYDAFLVNGQIENSLAMLNSDTDQIMLRMINGSTSSYYDVEYAGGPMTLVAADGQDVVPIAVKRLRISTAETYDVVVPLISGQSLELRATSFDGSGYSSMFLGTGDRILAPDVPKPNLFLMQPMDMSMEMEMEMSSEPDGSMSMEMSSKPDGSMPMEMPSEPGGSMPMEMSSKPGGSMPMEMPSEPDGSMPNQMPGQVSAANNQANAHDQHQQPVNDDDLESEPMNHMNMPGDVDVIAHMTDYQHLRATAPTTLPENQVWRDISLTLTGNMERYIWSFNDKTAREEPQILIRKGENVRFHLSNSTMMHHPLHLHGHFFRVVNQHGERSPLKHTVNVPPMGNVVIEFDANEEEDWLFHCHNQFHMKAGMNRVVSYEQTSLFTSQIDKLIQPSMRWFNLNEFHLMSSFADYEFSLSDERHELDLELDTDLADTFELHLTYNYHLNRFASVFAGLESREHHHDNTHDIGIAGLNLTLPFLIDSEWRVDEHGEFRLELESEFQITRRFGFDWRWNTNDEHRYGFNYKLNNRWAITVHTDTEYGDGVGFQFYY